MNRRGFLGSILALSAAPAVLRAEWIMPVRPVLAGVGVNWAALTAAQKEVWAMALWREARASSFLDRFYEGTQRSPTELRVLKNARCFENPLVLNRIQLVDSLAPRPGLEPGTCGLTVRDSVRLKSGS